MVEHEEERETIPFMDGEVGTYPIIKSEAFQKLLRYDREEVERKDPLAYLKPQVEGLKKFPLRIPPVKFDLAIRKNLIWFLGYWKEDMLEEYRKRILWIINTSAIELPLLFVSWDVFNEVQQTWGLSIERFRKEKKIPPSVAIRPGDLRIMSQLRNEILFEVGGVVEDSEFMEQCRRGDVSLLSHRFLEVPGGKFVCNGLLPMEFQVQIRMREWGLINFENRITEDCCI